jgi:hypothetical protein
VGLMARPDNGLGPSPAITPPQQALYTKCTGSRGPLGDDPLKELVLICGRRGGKSRYCAFLACYFASKDYSRYLAAGEVATVAILASDRKQARAIFRFILGFLKTSPLLADFVDDEGQETIQLRNRVRIEISTATFRGTRGYTYAAVLCDEIAIWRSDESVNPDTEILRAIRPGMLTIPGAMLILASSPYAKSGELWRTYQRNFGRDNPRVLVWQADTQTMNPKADPVEIANSYEEDPQAASAEYGAVFRDDLIGFISMETLEAITQRGRTALPRRTGIQYFGFVDPGGGVNDSMTMAIGHRDGNTAVLDQVIEIRPPFNPDHAVTQCAALARDYGITRLVSDKYAAEWPVARFNEHGLSLDQCAMPRSDLYLNFLSLANSGRVELLDNGRVLSQFAALQRRAGRSGKDSVDHPRDAHDDLANSVAGVLVSLDLDRRPGLVEQGRLVQKGGDGFAIPDTREKPVIATVCVNKHGQVGVVYSLRTGRALLLLDIDQGFFTSQFLSSVAARAMELQASIPLSVSASTYWVANYGDAPDVPSLYLNGMGSAASVNSFANVRAFALDIKPEELVMFVPAYTEQGMVRYSTIVVEKSRTLSLGGALDIRPGVNLEDDVLRAAAIASVVIHLPDASQLTMDGRTPECASLG